MNRCRLLFVAAVVVASFVATSFAKDKSDLNRVITHARFVMVTTEHGNRLDTNQIPIEDRNALFATEEALRKWGRYIEVFSADEADLILVVRAGRIVGVHSGVGVPPVVVIGRMPPSNTDPSRPNNDPTPPGIPAGAEVGPKDDMLMVYDAHLGTDSSPLWRRTAAHGLNGPDVPLLKELKHEIDEADKADAAKKKP